MPINILKKRYWLISGDIFLQSRRLEEHEIFLCVSFGLNISREAIFAQLYTKYQQSTPARPSHQSTEREIWSVYTPYNNFVL
jgi:hypothetical protein